MEIPNKIHGLMLLNQSKLLQHVPQRLAKINARGSSHSTLELPACLPLLLPNTPEHQHKEQTQFQRVFLCSTFLLLGTFHAHSLQPKDGTGVMPPTFHAWRQEFPRPKSLRLAELPFGGARGLGCHSTPKKTSSAVNNIPGVMNRCFGPSIFGPSPGLNARRLTPAEAPRLARSPPPFPSSPAPPRARSRGLRDGRSRWRRERQRVIIIDRGKEGEG